MADNSLKLFGFEISRTKTQEAKDKTKRLDRITKEENTFMKRVVKITDKLMSNYPNILIDASGEAVGVPKGYQGNSEVGHMTIGSGRIILESLEKINSSIKNKKFFKILKKTRSKL